MSREASPNNSIRTSNPKNSLVARRLQDVLHQSFSESQRLSDVFVGHPRVLELSDNSLHGRAADLLAEGLLDVLESTLEFGLVLRYQEFSFRFSLDDSLIEPAGLY